MANKSTQDATTSHETEISVKSLSKLKISGVLLAVIAIWWASQYLYLIPRTVANGEPGVFGDSFGSVNALFSGLAFLGVIYAVYLQRQDLRLQMRELAETREILKAQQEEVKAQRQQAELQTKTFSQQTFENTFFQLLRLRQDVIGGLTDYRSGSDRFRGAACLPRFEDRLREIFNLVKNGQTAESRIAKPATEVTIHEFYEQFWIEAAPYLEPLHRITEAILQQIASTPEIPKQKYVDILRSCMWRPELILLLYDVVYSRNHRFDEALPKLLTEYRLLRDLPTKLLIDPSHDSWGSCYTGDF